LPNAAAKFQAAISARSARLWALVRGGCCSRAGICWCSSKSTWMRTL